MKSSALLFVFIVSLLFFSCSSSLPDVKAVRAVSIFDYTDGDSYPRMRLAVFTETGSDVRRAESIRIVSKETGWEWKADDVEIFSSDAKMWAGYTNFVSPGDRAIPQGAYTLFYTDALGHDAESSFSVSSRPIFASLSTVRKISSLFSFTPSFVKKRLKIPR